MDRERSPQTVGAVGLYVISPPAPVVAKIDMVAWSAGRLIDVPGGITLGNR